VFVVPEIPRIAHEIGRCQIGSSNQPAPQSQLDLIHGQWSQEDSDKLVGLLRSDQKLPKVAKQLRRTSNQCRFRKTFVNQRDNAKAVAEAMIHVQPAPAQPPAMAGSGNVPFWDQQGGEEGSAGHGAGGAENTPFVRMVGTTRIIWKDEELIRWAQDRARMIRNYHSINQAELYEILAYELNQKNDTNICGSTVRLHLKEYISV
jgi:hypothetical protein